MILVVRRLFNLVVSLYSTPGGLLATPATTSVVLSWTYPAGTNPRSAQAIVLTDSVGTVISTTDAGVGTSATLTGLTVSTAYQVAVRASYTGQPDRLGTFVAFTTSAATPPAPPAATVPGAPTGVTAVAGDASAVVSWTAPASDGGSPITSYQVRTTTSAGATTTAGLSSSATSFTVSGLVNGTACTFAVAAVNAVGLSAFSAESSSVIPSAAPAVQVSVASNGGAPFSSLTPDCGQAFTVSARTQVNAIAIQPGAGVLFPAGTVFGLADSSYVPMPSSAPTTSSLGSATGGSTVAGDFVQVTLNNVVDLLVGPTYYAYVFVPGDVQRPAGANAMPPTLSGVIASLGPAYYYNGGPPVKQPSYYVPFKLYTAPAPAPSAPSAPTAVTAAAGVASVVVTWAAAASNGSPVTAYSVRAFDGVTLVTTVAAGTALAVDVQGLTNGTAYTFDVAATNGMGAGPASVASSPATPSAPAPSGIFTDSFGRADFLTLGPNYSRGDTDQLSMIAGRAQYPLGSSNHASSICEVVRSVNVDISATFAITPVDGGITFRFVDKNNYYVMRCSSSTGQLIRYGGVAGYGSVLINLPGYVAGDVQRVTVIGDQFTLYKNGVLVATATVSDFLTANKHGLFGYASNDAFASFHIEARP